MLHPPGTVLRTTAMTSRGVHYYKDPPNHMEILQATTKFPGGGWQRYGDSPHDSCDSYNKLF